MYVAVRIVTPDVKLPLVHGIVLSSPMEWWFSSALPYMATNIVAQQCPVSASMKSDCSA